MNYEHLFPDNDFSLSLLNCQVSHASFSFSGRIPHGCPNTNQKQGGWWLNSLQLQQDGRTIEVGCQTISSLVSHVHMSQSSDYHHNVSQRPPWDDWGTCCAKIFRGSPSPPPTSSWPKLHRLRVAMLSNIPRYPKSTSRASSTWLPLLYFAPVHETSTVEMVCEGCEVEVGGKCAQPPFLFSFTVLEWPPATSNLQLVLEAEWLYHQVPGFQNLLM